MKSLTKKIALIATVLALTGCSHKKVKEPEADLSVAAPKEAEVASSDLGNALGLVSIHFPYKSSAMNAAAKAELQSDLAILQSNPQLKVQIEGHCDQRGGIQYNMALGEKRARAVKKTLVILGIDESRLSTISMGKEKPVDPSENEEAYAKNRRANFVITK